MVKIVAMTVLLAMTAGAAEETDQWQAAIDRAAAAGGGRVTIPAGRHEVGQLELKNGVELHLEDGAVLEGLVGLEHYRLIDLPYSEGAWSAVVLGIGVTNVAITGKGEIFGNGPKWDPAPKGFHGSREGRRARGVFFAFSKGLRFEDWKLNNAACWGVVLKNCEDVLIRNVSIWGHGNMNNDGFDIEAKNVRVENCEADTGDDCFCVKSNDPDFIVENVVFSNCTARGQANCYKIGTATRGIVRNVRFENCRCDAPRGIFTEYASGKKPPYPFHYTVFSRPEHYPYGFSLTGVSIECVDGALVENVVVDGFEMVDAVKIPIFVRADLRQHHNVYDGFRRGVHNKLRNVTLKNIRGYAMGPQPSIISGVEGFRVENVRLENIDIFMPGAGEIASKKALSEPFPYRQDCYPSPDIFHPHLLPAYGLVVDHADNVTMENVNFRLLPGPCDKRPAIFNTGK